MSLQTMFMLFMVYSVIGYLMEVVVVSFKNRRLTDRGFLIGPYCPIYGCGALLITLFLSKYVNDIPVLFVMSCVFGASLEYFSSYIMEKIFKTRWWDYSSNKYNLNGRICLFTTVCFGSLGVILIHFLNPFFMGILSLIPSVLLNILAVILFVIFVVDVIVSFNIISNIKKVDLSDAKDTTDEITRMVRDTLKKHSYFTKRLTVAFPNFEVKFKDTLKKFKNKSN